MDPKNTAQLDPKLKEAYERVMRTTVTPPPAGNQAPLPQAPSPSPAPQSVAQNPANQTQPLPTHETPITQTQASNPPPPLTPSPDVTSSFSGFKAGSLKANKKRAVSPALLMILAVVFFIAYTFIWVKVLGVNLPFLP